MLGDSLIDVPWGHYNLRDKIESQLNGMLEEGFLELVDKPGLGFVPLGLVPKPPPPPDPVTGEIDTKSSGMRIISDLSASGLNACMYS